VQKPHSPLRFSIEITTVTGDIRYDQCDCIPEARNVGSMLIAFHKPYGVLSQFTQEQEGQRTLAEFGFPPNVYPVGRLDRDSEGLLLLSDEPGISTRLLHPRSKHQRTYWAQVEGRPDEAALEPLKSGLDINGRRTLPCHAKVLKPQPVLADRKPPIRSRQNVPTSWLEIQLIEGKNRQVRRMTATIGYPTLRLLRVAIGSLRLGDLAMGKWKHVSASERRLLAENML
jgi:23S rRNA pseudouridine2457 synthase